MDRHPNPRVAKLQDIVDEILLAGDPWELSDIGVSQMSMRLDACLEALAWCFEKFESETDRRFAFKAVNELLLTMRETIWGFHNIRHVATKQAYIAQSAKSRKAAVRRATLFKCIKAEAQAQNRVLSKGIKFASLIRPGVRQRLGLDPEGIDWPSASSIKVAVVLLGAGEAKTSRTGPMKARSSRPDLRNRGQR